jgi:excisionase family DNA binding protein
MSRLVDMHYGELKDKLISDLVPELRKAINFAGAQASAGLAETMKLDQVAGYLKMTTANVRRLIATGKLKAIKAGGAWIVTQDQLKDYLNARQRPTAVTPETEGGAA